MNEDTEIAETALIEASTALTLAGVILMCLITKHILEKHEVIELINRAMILAEMEQEPQEGSLYALSHQNYKRLLDTINNF